MPVATSAMTAEAFGFKLVKMSIAAGASYSYIIPARVARKDFPALQLWVSGRVAIENAGSTMPDRTRGVLTTELDDVLEAGMLKITAIEDGAWWCLDANKNNGVLPSVTKFEYQPGTDFVASSDMKMFVCDGEIAVGTGVVVTGGSVSILSGDRVVSASGAIGLLF